MTEEIRQLVNKYNQAVEKRNRILHADDRHTIEYQQAIDHAFEMENSAAHDLAYAVAQLMQEGVQ